VKELVLTSPTKSYGAGPGLTTAIALSLGCVIPPLSEAIPFDLWPAQRAVSYIPGLGTIGRNYQVVASGTETYEGELLKLLHSSGRASGPEVPTPSLSYIKAMAFLPIDRAAEAIADEYFANKTRMPRKVRIPPRG
jgi:hypothetical protein